MPFFNFNSLTEWMHIKPSNLLSTITLSPAWIFSLGGCLEYYSWWKQFKFLEVKLLVALIKQMTWLTIHASIVLLWVPGYSPDNLDTFLDKRPQKWWRYESIIINYTLASAWIFPLGGCLEYENNLSS